MIKDCSFDAALGTCLLTGKPISLPARPGQADPHAPINWWAFLPWLALTALPHSLQVNQLKMCYAKGIFSPLPFLSTGVPTGHVGKPRAKTASPRPGHRLSPCTSPGSSDGSATIRAAPEGSIRDENICFYSHRSCRNHHFKLKTAISLLKQTWF